MKKKRQGKPFWLERDENGYYGIGPTKLSTDREIPDAIAPRISEGETIRVRIVEA